MTGFKQTTGKQPTFEDEMRKYRKQHRDKTLSLRLHEYYMSSTEKRIIKRKEAYKKKK